MKENLKSFSFISVKITSHLIQKFNGRPTRCSQRDLIQLLGSSVSNGRPFYYSIVSFSLLLLLFLFFLQFLCRRFLGDGSIDQVEIFRKGVSSTKPDPSFLFFRNLLPVGSYCPLIEIQRTSLSAPELKIGLSQNTGIFTKDRGHVANVHNGSQIFRKCLVWKLGRGQNIGHESRVDF